MSTVDQTYRVVIYYAPQVCKNEDAVQRILDYVSQERSTLLRCLRRSRIFMIEALTRENAEACAQGLRDLGVEVDVEETGIAAAQKAWLLQEGQKWVKRGLIFHGTANKILSHYGIEERLVAPIAPKPEKDPKALIKTVLYIGATLIGLGIILFIAANWDKISDAVKIVGATLLSLSLLHAGYRVQFGSSPRAYLGHGLFWAAALAMGGTIMLIAQIYHVQAESYLLPLLWGAVILPLPLLLHVPSIAFLCGGLWFLSHLYYGDSHGAFFWPYPVLLLGILLPLSLKTENRPLYLFNVASLMLSSLVATTLSAPWANLLYAASLFALYVLKRDDYLQTLALFCLALWNISFVMSYETLPNLFYLLPLVYFFGWDYQHGNQQRMILHALNSLFWLFTLFYQIEQRFDLTSPKATDILLFLITVGLTLFALGRRLQGGNWSHVSQVSLLGGIATGWFFVYLLSFRFYQRQTEMVNSPVYLVAVVTFLVLGLSLFLGALSTDLSRLRQRGSEVFLFALVAASVIVGLVVPAKHVVHVLTFNAILFLSAFIFMLQGFRQKRLDVYNSGVVLFVIFIISRYFDTLWKFMPRSLFFIIGGIFLVAWAFFFDKKRRMIVQSLKAQTP